MTHILGTLSSTQDLDLLYGHVFQRVLTADLLLLDGECLVVSGYINLATFNMTLTGNARLEIL